jgi:hypothetical protein
MRHTEQPTCMHMTMKLIENVPLVTGATAYNDPPSNSTTFILVFSEAFYFGTKLDHSHINPNQIRAYGIPLWDNPCNVAHSLSIEVNPSLYVTLTTLGTKVGFRTRVPMSDELATLCEHVTMTSLHPWNPSEVVMLQPSNGSRRMVESMEAPLCERDEHVPMSQRTIQIYGGGFGRSAFRSVDPLLVRTVETLRMRHVHQLDTVLDHVEMPTQRTCVNDERHVKLLAELIAEYFGIGPTCALQTRHGIRSAILPISRRYRSVCMFGVRRLNGKFATDSSYRKPRSLRSNVSLQFVLR